MSLKNPKRRISDRCSSDWIQGVINDDGLVTLKEAFFFLRCAYTARVSDDRSPFLLVVVVVVSSIEINIGRAKEKKKKKGRSEWRKESRVIEYHPHQRRQQWFSAWNRKTFHNESLCIPRSLFAFLLVYYSRQKKRREEERFFTHSFLWFSHYIGHHH